MLTGFVIGTIIVDMTIGYCLTSERTSLRVLRVVSKTEDDDATIPTIPSF